MSSNTPRLAKQIAANHTPARTLPAAKIRPAGPHGGQNLARNCGHTPDRAGDNFLVPCSPLLGAPAAPIALALMTSASKSTFVLGHRHLLGIEGLSATDISGLLDLSEEYVELNRQVDKKRTSLRGRTQI